MDQNPHVLLTGGQGRVAQALREALAGDGWKLSVCSRTPGNGMISLEEMLSGTGPLGVDAVVHCAWSTVPAVAQENPDHTAAFDIPLLNRLIARLKADPKPPVLLFMSTGAVYGPIKDAPSKETDDACPIGNYARGKREAEQLIEASDLPFCILRVSNLYALPSKPNDRQGVIARLVRMAIQGGTFEQWGAHSIKDYLHSADFAEALKAVIRKDMRGIVNIASGKATDLADLIKLVNNEVGTDLNVVLKPAADWDVTNNQLDISLLQAATGWFPKVSIEQGVHDEVAHLRAG